VDAQPQLSCLRIANTVLERKQSKPGSVWVSLECPGQALSSEGASNQTSSRDAPGVILLEKSGAQASSDKRQAQFRMILMCKDNI